MKRKTMKKKRRCNKAIRKSSRIKTKFNKNMTVDAQLQIANKDK